MAFDQETHSPPPTCSSAQGGCSFQPDLSKESILWTPTGHVPQKRHIPLPISRIQASSQPMVSGTPLSLVSRRPQTAGGQSPTHVAFHV